MEPTLRPFEPADIDAVVDLALRAWAPIFASMADVLGPEINALVHPDWAASQEAEVRTACHEHVATVAVTEDDGVVGFVTVLVHARRGIGQISMIAVDPSAQRAGVGRALTEHALAQLRAAGCRLAMVATGGDAGHARARRLYGSAGFTCLPLVNYYRLL